MNTTFKVIFRYFYSFIFSLHLIFLCKLFVSINPIWVIDTAATVQTKKVVFNVEKILKDATLRKLHSKEGNYHQNIQQHVILPGKEKTCFKTIMETESYPCIGTDYKDKCEEVPFTKQKKCLKTFEEKVPYECTRVEYRNNCKEVVESIDDTCVKVEVKKEPYTCHDLQYETSCHDVPVNVVGKCYKTVLKPVPYECTKEKVEQKCKDFTVHVEGVCEKTVMKKSQYDCSTTEYVLKCSNPPSLPPMKSNFDPPLYSHEDSVFTPLSQNNYLPGKENIDIQEENFSQNNFPPNKENINIQDQDSFFPLSENNSVPNNENVAPNKQDIPLDLSKGSPSSGDKSENIVHEQNDSTEKNSTKELRTLRPKKKIKKTFPDIPAKTVNEVICENVPKIVHKNCFTEVPTKETYSCIKQQVQPKCEPVSIIETDTCYNTVPVQESYECEKTEMKQECKNIPVKVQKTCERSLPYEKKYTCKIQNYKTECVPSPITVPSICFKAKPVTQSYPCPETSLQKVCETMEVKVKKLCTREKEVNVPYTCEEVVVTKQHFIPHKEGNANAPYYPSKNGRISYDESDVFKHGKDSLSNSNIQRKDLPPTKEKK